MSDKEYYTEAIGKPVARLTKLEQMAALVTQGGLVVSLCKDTPCHQFDIDFVAETAVKLAKTILLKCDEVENG